MAKRKVVFIIVEGLSDQDALERYFVKFFNSSQIITKVMYGDITIKAGVNQTNIKSRLGNIVREKLKQDKLTKADVARIIHIVDMDGAYIDDTAVRLDKSCFKPVYSKKCIRTINVESICQRNRQKRENLDALSSNKSGILKGIPYKVYYMSCNLDHVLYDLQNATDEQKEELSLNFSEKYIDNDNIDRFIQFICKSKFSRIDSYEASWQFIKQDKHSLERYSNVGLCFQ